MNDILDDNQIETMLKDAIQAFRPSPDHKNEVREAVLTAAARQQQNSFKTRRRWLLRLGVPLATAASVLLAVGLWPNLSRREKVYGMQDLPHLWQSAHTVHWKCTRWNYSEAKGESDFLTATVIPMEQWVDIPNCKSYNKSFMNMSNHPIERTEGIRFGKYAMSYNHKKKTVRYQDVGELYNKLEVRRELHQPVYIIGMDDLDRFIKVGEEQIAGQLYDVWQTEHPFNGGLESITVRVKCWLSPTTGNLAQVITWYKREGESDWRLDTIQTLDRDVVIPPEVFDTNPPPGYTAENTLENPGIYRDTSEFSFTLDDGSVIVGWRVKNDKTKEPLDTLFASVRPGDVVPDLPLVIEELKILVSPYVTRPDVFYSGRHLAYTRKNGVFTEWALFVPRSQPPSIMAGRSYAWRDRTQPEIPKIPRVLWANVIQPDEFDSFVVEAMAMTSDSGKTPEGVTYASVIALAESLRSKLAR